MYVTEHEELMEQALLNYAKKLTPLSKQSIDEMAKHMPECSTSDKDNCNDKIDFKEFE